MTTREYLSQIRKLSLMVEAKLEERYRLQSLACRITVPIEGERVKSSSDPDRLTNAVAKIIKCENQLDALITRLIDKRNEIIVKIDSLDNPSMYSILTYKYVQCLSDKEISVKMGISLSGISKVHKSALVEFEKRFGPKYLTTEDYLEYDHTEKYRKV